MCSFFAKFGIHMAVFSGGIVGRCFPLCTLTILYQQRGSHRRLGNAHGAREDPEARASGERETHRGQPWQAASCRPICLDTQCLACTQDRLPWLGLKAVETPSTSCESCQALSALFPIAGERAANTAEKKTIATILATTKGRNLSFKFT